jgi:hypothetical protein
VRRRGWAAARALSLIFSGGTPSYRLTERQHEPIEILDDDLPYVVDSIRRSLPNDSTTLPEFCGELIDAADPEVGIVRPKRTNARMARSASRQAIEKKFDVVAAYRAPFRRVRDKVTDDKAETIAVVVHRGEDIGDGELRDRCGDA